MLAALIAALAVYRLSHMIAYEDGPWDVFTRLRGHVSAASWDGRPETWGRHWTARGISCPLCISFWLSWLAALALPWQGLVWYALTALALSGMTVALVEVTSRDNT